MLSAVLLWVGALAGTALSAEILAVFPHTGKSHYDVFEPLVLELAARGHHLTVVSFFPQSRGALAVNLTDVSLEGAAPKFVEIGKFDDMVKMGPVYNYFWITDIGFETCKAVLRSDQMKKLIGSGRKFDLMIIEMFNTDCFFSFSSLFDVSGVVAFASCTPFPYHGPRVGVHDNLATVSNVFLPMAGSLMKHSLWERTVNTLATLGVRLAHWLSSAEQRVVDAIPALSSGHSLQTLAANVSLLLVNSHHSLLGARAVTPGLVEVGGIHIRDPKPLEQDLEKFLSESPEGVLLFSMGSVLQSSSFPADKRQAFMDAFSELPVRVLMKWEQDTLPGKPDNVRLSRWLPQRDVLAHPKVRAFMGHGGLLSTSEAVYCGVPMVLIPMFGDQPNNVAHLRATGAAVRLNYQDITKVAVLRALKAVLFEPSYREKAKLLSEQYRDRPMAPLDTAVYWTEYVLRHKGARHLRSPAVDMPWYQLWLLDVIAVITASILCFIFIVFWLVKRVVAMVVSSKHESHTKKD